MLFNDERMQTPFSNEKFKRSLQIVYLETCLEVLSLLVVVLASFGILTSESIKFLSLTGSDRFFSELASNNIIALPKVLQIKSAQFLEKRNHLRLWFLLDHLQPSYLLTPLRSGAMNGRATSSFPTGSATAVRSTLVTFTKPLRRAYL